MLSCSCYVSEPASSKVKMSCKTQCNKNKQYCQAQLSIAYSSFFLSPFLLSFPNYPYTFLLILSSCTVSFFPLSLSFPLFLSLYLSHSHSLYLHSPFLFPSSLSLSVFFLLIYSFYPVLLSFLLFPFSPSPPLYLCLYFPSVSFSIST